MISNKSLSIEDEKRAFAEKILRSLWETFYLEKEMGKGLGKCQILFKEVLFS